MKSFGLTPTLVREGSKKEHHSGHAFGYPDLSPTWQTARKNGVGTAYSPRSRVWFTLARGIVTEVYYPRVDVANTRDLHSW